MAIYRTISQSFWTDSKVEDNFTPEDKYFYLYLLTNPHTNICGCYEISKKQIANETGYNTDTVERLLERFKNVHKVIDYDRETKEVLIINWSKYNWTRSEKLIKAVMKTIPYIKNKEFQKYISDLVHVDNSQNDTVSIPYTYPIHTGRYPMDTSVSVSVSVPNTNTNTSTVSDTEGYNEEETAAIVGSAHEAWKKVIANVSST